LLDLQIGLALLLATLSAFFAHFLQCAHATFVAGAPGLYSLTNPGFFLGELFVEFRVGAFSRRKLLFAKLQKAAAVPVPVAQQSAIQFKIVVGDRLQKAAVVADENDRAAIGEQVVFVPFDGPDGQVVGGFL